MSYLKVFTNTLTDTETHINIQNLFIEKGQRFFLIFFFNFLNCFQVLSNILDIFLKITFVQFICHGIIILCCSDIQKMLLKVCSILKGNFAPSSNADSGRIPLFKTKNTRVSLWPQAATNLHINGHTFQMQKSIVQCGKSSQQLNCVCRTQWGLGGHQWEQLESLYIHISTAYKANRHERKTMSWTQMLEDVCCSGKEERKQRRAEVCVVNYLPGYKEGDHGWNRTWGSFQKDQEPKIQLAVYDRPARLHLSKTRNHYNIYGVSWETNFSDTNGRTSIPSSGEPKHF